MFSSGCMRAGFQTSSEKRFQWFRNLINFLSEPNTLLPWRMALHLFILLVNQPMKLFLTYSPNAKKISTDLHNESNLIFSTFYGTLAKGGVNTFGCNYGFEIKFEFLKFWVEVDKFDEVSQSIRKDKFLERLLHKPLSSSEIDLLVKTLGDTIYAHIDFHTKKNGIR